MASRKVSNPLASPALALARQHVTGYSELIALVIATQHGKLVIPRKVSAVLDGLRRQRTRAGEPLAAVGLECLFR